MMKSAFITSIAFATAVQAYVHGFDIAYDDPTVNFNAVALAAGFVIIQGTAGDNFVSPTFSSQYGGATRAGLIRGGYHSAHPGKSPGEAQADYFAAHGGGWSADGITLPGMLKLGSGFKDKCWGLSASEMVSWIQAFSDQYYSLQGVYPMLSTSTSWWDTCTGDSKAFASTNPLVLVHHSNSVGKIPGGWSHQTIWQNSGVSRFGGSSDVFNGNKRALVALAAGRG